MSDQKDCFIISPIGEPDTDIRERADKLRDYVIEPAVQPLGYEPIRADEIDEPGMITSQIIEYVVESPLVIADLTGSNPNVFYELAVRHASQKPIIQLIKKGENIPFDVAGTRTIKIDLQDIESVERAKDTIGEQIDKIEPGTQEIETPISAALTLKDLRESDDPEERSLADIMETLSELRSNMVSLQNDLNDPEDLVPPEYLEQVIHRHNEREKTRRVRQYSMLKDVIEEFEELSSKEGDVNVDDLEDIEENLQRLFHHQQREVGGAFSGDAGSYEDIALTDWMGND